MIKKIISFFVKKKYKKIGVKNGTLVEIYTDIHGNKGIFRGQVFFDKHINEFFIRYNSEFCQSSVCDYFVNYEKNFKVVGGVDKRQKHTAIIAEKEQPTDKTIFMLTEYII